MAALQLLEIMIEPWKQNLHVKQPRTLKMVNIDVTDVSKTKTWRFDVFFKKPRFYRYFFQKKFEL